MTKDMGGILTAYLPYCPTLPGVFLRDVSAQNAGIETNPAFSPAALLFFFVGYDKLIHRNNGVSNLAAVFFIGFRRSRLYDGQGLFFCVFLSGGAQIR
jgi:hypothetical protein